jgi:hypothetical protein
MELEGLLLHSEKPNIESYPEPTKSSPHDSSIAAFRQKSYMHTIGTYSIGRHENRMT